MKILPAILVFVFVVAAVAASPIASAQTSEIQTTEQQVKESIHRVAEAVICLDEQLLDSVGLGRERCNNIISTFSSECWAVLDEWITDYGLKNMAEDQLKYERIAIIYVFCQEARFLKTWVRTHIEESD